MSVRRAPLPIADDDLVACVQCGLCLPHCPTFRVTGLEIASPRGRITAMRAAQAGTQPIDGAFSQAMEQCVQCRACETACPSAVPFGRMMEGARVALHEARATRPTARALLEWVAYRLVLPSRRLLRALTWVVLAAQRLRLVPRRLGIPPLTVAGLRRPLRADAPDARDPVYLFTGCVMDAWMRDTHRAAIRVLHACGARVTPSGPGAACCGALHAHAGRREEARSLARRVIAAMPGDAPVLVDSAGCGAAMKEYGERLGTAEARAFAARVRDVAEWVAARGVPAARRTGRTVVVQDPCHLRHVQHADGAVRSILAGAYELPTPDDDGLCCGAGGAYAVVQPELARAIRDRKVAALRAAAGTEDPLVASANPGCVLHLAAGGIRARHPVELLADALEDRP